MSPTADQLLSAAMKLPEGERAELAARLWESTDDCGYATPEIAAAWQEEIARRIQESDAGIVESIPAEEVDRRLNERYPFLRDSLPSTNG